MTASSETCKHLNTRLRPGSPDYEYFVAEDELSKGELKHAAVHLSRLLSCFSSEPRSLELFEIIYQKALTEAGSEEALEDYLFYSQDHFDAQIEALRALVWQRQGKLEEAILLLLSIKAERQDLPYLESWALDWIKTDDVQTLLSDQLFLQLFSTVVKQFPEAKANTLDGLELVERWARLFSAIVDRRKLPGLEFVLSLKSDFYRKAGLLDQAEAVADQMQKEGLDWQSSLMRALVKREQGDLAAAESEFKKTIEIRPQDISIRCEAADMYLHNSDFQKAIIWYESALALAATDELACPSLLYCRFMLERKKRDFAELVDLLKVGNQRARILYHKAFGGLPPPQDASASILKQLRKDIIESPQNACRGEVLLSLGSLEAPSNYLAFALEMEALQHDLKLTVNVDEIPDPDPREAIADFPYRIWRYEGSNAVPALPAPASDCIEAIAELALSPYDEKVNWALASRIARRIGSRRVSEILACFVHPGPLPKGRIATSWLCRWQLSCAQVSAQLDRGWDASVRKIALLSVLFGPSDWATSAVIRAMTQLAEYEPQFAEQVNDAFAALAAKRPRRGYCCWEYTLYSCWIRVPRLLEEEQIQIGSRLMQLERN